MHHSVNVPIYMLTPFVIMLGAIAVMPLAANHFWENNKNKLIVSLVLGVPVALWLLFKGMGAELANVVVYDYLPFIILLGALFIVTGGIFIDGDIEAKPKINTTFMAIGALLASLTGTTGAAMLLIRPLISTNKERNHKVHTILFFIGIVANSGGLLTPLGDPPLFMMYLRGVDFFWFASLFKEWIFVNGLLLIIYYFVDTHYWNKETPEAKAFDHTNIRPITIAGKLNFLWLVGIVISVALVNENTFEFIKADRNLAFIREAAIILMAGLSLGLTKKKVRTDNNFSWEPIEEVAFLFLGIFITMAPALEYLKLHASTLGVKTPQMFYYATGLLSSFLDNTPTAVTFYSLAVGLVEQNPELATGNLIAGIPEIIMSAICLGAVMFGAMTYIGNGPNFMVKAIAEQSNIKMPDFFSYILKFSIIVLLPVFILAQIIFL